MLSRVLCNLVADLRFLCIACLEVDCYSCDRGHHKLAMKVGWQVQDTGQEPVSCKIPGAGGTVFGSQRGTGGAASSGFPNACPRTDLRTFEGLAPAHKTCQADSEAPNRYVEGTLRA